ncbi:Phosphoribosylglycinamide formyltransferase [Phycisphaerae bacterium RAS2]|nr:Phosphoribosylglycinamide formyltransferase [Phycisphaerae bacterium RAS2]
MSRRGRDRRRDGDAAREGGRSGSFRLAVLISGGGSTLQNLIDRMRDGRLPGVEISVVISSRSDVAGVARAEAAGLPVDVIRVKDHPDAQRFSDHVTLTLDVFMPDLVVQAGWLCYWIVPPRWMGKVINLHPALLPRHGGKGMYGRHVHEAVLAAGDSETGATVHWVDNEYDHGGVIAQARCPVQAGDTPDALAERVQALERELLPRTILAIRRGEVRRGAKCAK